MDGHKGSWSSAGPWLCDDDCPHLRCIVERALEADEPMFEGCNMDHQLERMFDAQDAAETALAAIPDGWAKVGEEWIDLNSGQGTALLRCWYAEYPELQR